MWQRLLEFLRNLIRRLFQRESPPGPIVLEFISISILQEGEEIDMEDTIIRVIWPTTRADGSPLLLGHISHAVVELAVRNDPDWFGSPRTIPPTPGEPFTEYTQQAMDAGTYYFRARCVDIEGREGEEVIVQHMVGGGTVDSPPGPVVLEVRPAPTE